MVVLPQPCLYPHLLRIWWFFTHRTFWSARHSENSHVVAVRTFVYSDDHTFSRRDLQATHSSPQCGQIHNSVQTSGLISIGQACSRNSSSSSQRLQIICERSWSFSFHVAVKTATMSYERRCCQTFPATMLALDPTANHHSSSL